MNQKEVTKGFWTIFYQIIASLTHASVNLSHFDLSFSKH